jgi:hypothetical protein
VTRDRSIDYYVARAINDTASRKYINPQDVLSSEIIFNERFIDWSKRLFIVEGMFDYLKLHGVNRTCLLGSSLSSRSKLFGEILKRGTKVCMMLDTDANEKAEKICCALRSYGIDAVVDENTLTSHGVSDPGELVCGTVKKFDESLWVKPNKLFVARKLNRKPEMVTK